MPISPSGGGGSSLSTMKSFISVLITVNNAASTNVTSLTLTSGTWLIFYQVLQLNGGNVSFTEAWVGTNNNSFTGAIGGAEMVLPGGYTGTLSGVVTVTPSGSTTYYLNAFNSNGFPNNVTWFVEPTGTSNNTGAQVSGMTAVKIA